MFDCIHVHFVMSANLVLCAVWTTRSISTVSTSQASAARCRTLSAGTTTSRASAPPTVATSALRSPTAAGGTTSVSTPTWTASTTEWVHAQISLCFQLWEALMFTTPSSCREDITPPRAEAHWVRMGSCGIPGETRITTRYARSAWWSGLETSEPGCHPERTSTRLSSAGHGTLFIVYSSSGRTPVPVIVR